ncbi:hypothetical protein ACFOLJ_18190 [Rugamonas sp. CCM 8940]|uniref:hypothetical protein n=1 Tax=Rugamonas sp. CCM 8940 TaxID=2765359 RepID=UPI0018F7AA63|nr:hypothetical protein [Rugamonas sp. CCM 8940]MBJ7312410.1 hypothetical protein [Rugamonas sp. CCM 8940]
MELKVKYLTRREADVYVNSVGMAIGDWNQISTIDSIYGGGEWTNYSAPKDARELFNFSEHVVDWIPDCNWIILQIDNSGGLDVVQSIFFNRLIFGSGIIKKSVGSGAILFEFEGNFYCGKESRVLISNLLALLLLFESHGYLITSKKSAGRYLSFQDGYMYFHSNKCGINDANYLLINFDKNPSGSVGWVNEILINSQEGD